MLLKLNSQMNREFYASNLYLHLSNWCSEQSLNGTATFLRAGHRVMWPKWCACLTLWRVSALPPSLKPLMFPVKTELSGRTVPKTMEEYEQRSSTLAQLADEAKELNDDSTVNFLRDLEKNSSMMVCCCKPFLMKCAVRNLRVCALCRPTNMFWMSCHTSCIDHHRR